LPALGELVHLVVRPRLETDEVLEDVPCDVAVGVPGLDRRVEVLDVFVEVQAQERRFDLLRCVLASVPAAPGKEAARRAYG
jgi:hypothetical protein